MRSVNYIILLISINDPVNEPKVESLQSLYSKGAMQTYDTAV